MLATITSMILIMIILSEVALWIQKKLHIEKLFYITNIGFTIISFLLLVLVTILEYYSKKSGLNIPPLFIVINLVAIIAINGLIILETFNPKLKMLFRIIYLIAGILVILSVLLYPTMLIPLLLAVAIVVVMTLQIINKYPDSKNYFIIGYIPLIVFLSILIIIDVRKPIQFEKEMEIREDATIARLKIISRLQDEYESKYKKCTASFDTLIDFAKTGYEYTDVVGEYDVDKYTEKEAVRLGLAEEIILKKSREEIESEILKEYADFDQREMLIFLTRVNIFELKPAIKENWKENMYKKLTVDMVNINYDDIRYVPFADTNQFVMRIGTVEESGTTQQVFETNVPYEVLLHGLDKQLIINESAQKEKITKFPGLKVGSLDESGVGGNWDK